MRNCPLPPLCKMSICAPGGEKFSNMWNSRETKFFLVLQFKDNKKVFFFGGGGTRPLLLYKLRRCPFAPSDRMYTPLISELFFDKKTLCFVSDNPIYIDPIRRRHVRLIISASSEKGGGGYPTWGLSLWLS